MTLDNIGQLASKVSTAMDQLQSIYRQLIQAVHDTKDIYTPKQVRAQLQNSLPKSRVAEILRIAYTNEIIYQDYIQRITGFRLALAKARGQYHKERLSLRFIAEFERLTKKQNLSETFARSGDSVLIVLENTGSHTKKLGDITVKTKYEKAGTN